MNRIFARPIILLFLFALPALADDDGIRIVIKNENGHTEHSYIADYMSNYLDLLPQVDGDTVEIMGRWDYSEAKHGDQYSASTKTVKELFDLLQEHFRAEILEHDGGRTLEFTVPHKNFWYIVEKYEDPNIGSVQLRIRRPISVCISSELVATPDENLPFWANRDNVIIPFNAKQKVFVPYAYGLVSVSVCAITKSWSFQIRRSHRAAIEFQSVSQRAVVSEESGLLYREVTRF